MENLSEILFTRICFHSRSLNGQVSSVFEDQSKILLSNPIYGAGSLLFGTISNTKDVDEPPREEKFLITGLNFLKCYNTTYTI